MGTEEKRRTAAARAPSMRIDFAENVSRTEHFANCRHQFPFHNHLSLLIMSWFDNDQRAKPANFPPRQLIVIGVSSQIFAPNLFRLSWALSLSGIDSYLIHATSVCKFFCTERNSL